MQQRFSRNIGACNDVHEGPLQWDESFLGFEDCRKSPCADLVLPCSTFVFPSVVAEWIFQINLAFLLWCVWLCWDYWSLGGIPFRPISSNGILNDRKLNI